MSLLDRYCERGRGFVSSSVTVGRGEPQSNPGLSDPIAVGGLASSPDASTSTPNGAVEAFAFSASSYLGPSRQTVPLWGRTAGTRKRYPRRCRPSDSTSQEARSSNIAGGHTEGAPAQDVDCAFPKQRFHPWTVAFRRAS